MVRTTFALLGALACVPCGVRADAGDKVKPVIPMKAQPFALSDVRLLDGPFKHAQEMDRAYLLALDPERLLHNFRVNAGLPSSAQPLGGWEAPDVELRGHFVGHYLSGCAKMYASTGDQKLKERAVYITAELAKCQAKLGNGYLSAFPESFIERVEKRQRVWAPWYTLHKILAGLIDTYELCGDRQALTVAEKMAGWAKGRMDKLTDAQMQGMLGNEHGGMNEALANLYALTGNKDWLALSQRFNHHAVIDPLSQGVDRLTGLHANTQIPKFIGCAREFELTGDKQMESAADYFWNVVTKERSYVIGGHSDGEGFSPKEHLSRYLGANSTETCNTYNMLKLTRHLFQWDPKAEYADYYERALYNHILASQNPADGMTCYYVPLRPGSRKNFSTPNGSFWCCTGTGVENHAQYGDSIYFHDADTLWVNLFIASELKWKEKGISVRQETTFPNAGTSKLVFTCAKPVGLAVLVRHPFWAGKGFALRVNGKPIAAGDPANYAGIERKWKTGDTLEITLPMGLRTEAFKDDPHRFAYLYGPIVLCAELGPAQAVPDVVTESGKVTDGIAPAGKPLCFTGPAKLFETPGSLTPVSLVPFFGKAQGRYTVYFDQVTPAQFAAKQKAAEEAEARRKALAGRTVDEVTPGSPRSERAHGLKSETSYAGDFGERRWRDARDGGYFQWEMKSQPGAAEELLVTYWGGDSGREFDILVDGTKIATQRLTGDHAGVFYDVSYPIPPELLAGKEKITVRFQAHPGRMAGGVFGCMVLKKQ